jgi:hypothetical protein
LLCGNGIRRLMRATGKREFFFEPFILTPA